jgi:hypothetical protein
VHSITGDYPAAIEFLEQAQATFCQLGSQYVGDHVIPQGFDQVIPQVLAVFLF